MTKQYLLTLFLFMATVGFGCKCDNIGVLTTNGRLSYSYQTAPEAIPIVADNTLNLDFGYVIVGQQKEIQITLRNTGQNDLNVTPIERGTPFPDEVRFSPTRMILQPGNEGVLTMVFAPKAEGARPGVLVLRHDGIDAPGTINFTGTGVTANLSFEPPELEFGTVVVGEESAPKTTLIKNNGGSPIDVFVLPIDGANKESFSYILQSSDQRLIRQIPAGGSVEMNVKFSPQVAGAAKAELAIRACTSCPIVKALVGGRGTLAGLVATPDPLDFGAVLPAVKNTRVLTLNNIGNRPITVQDMRFALPTTEFAVEKPVTGWPKLNPGDTTTVNISYTPAFVGSDIVRLFIDSDDARAPRLEVGVKGYGGGPVIDISPSPVDFGTAAIGFPVIRRITITNRGQNDNTTTSDSLILSSIELPVSAVDFAYSLIGGVTLPVTIDPGKRFTVDIKYDPKDTIADDVPLTFKSNDLANPEAKVSLRAKAVPARPCSYTISPSVNDGLKYGTVQRGRTAKANFTITNTGTDECILGKVDLSGASSAAFTIVGGPTYGKTLAAAESFAVEVEFTPLPTASSGTLYSGAVDISISSQSQPEQQMPLSGRGAEVCVYITPSYMDFGVIEPLCQTNARKFTIYNACNSTVSISKILEGSNAIGKFKAFPPSTGVGAGSTLAGGAKLEFTAVYRPTVAGDDTANIEVYLKESTAATAPEQLYLITVHGKAQVGAQVTEDFQQADKAKADILFVVDNSGSMSEEQAVLSTNFSSFMKFAIEQQLDYHLALTTTDVDSGGENGRFVPTSGGTRIITNMTINPEAVFKTNVNVGTNGSADEQPLEGAYRALSDPNLNNANSGFLRADAYLSVIFVTDEEDQSPKSVDFYVNYFQNLKGPRGTNLVSLSGIIGKDPAGCTSPNGESDYVSRVVEAASRTGGITESICNADWSVGLQKLGLNAFGYKSRFFLSSDPDQTTIKVQLDQNDGQGLVEVPLGPIWSYASDPTTNASTVEFLPTATPPAGSKIRVSYSVTCNPITN